MTDKTPENPLEQLLKELQKAATSQESQDLIKEGEHLVKDISSIFETLLNPNKNNNSQAQNETTETPNQEERTNSKDDTLNDGYEWVPARERFPSQKTTTEEKKEQDETSTSHEETIADKLENLSEELQENIQNITKEFNEMFNILNTFVEKESKPTK